MRTAVSTSMRVLPSMVAAAALQTLCWSDAAGQVQEPSAVAAACVADFDTTYAYVTHDYAGYHDRMTESAARIAAVTDSVRAEVRTVTSDTACTRTLQRWIAVFAEHDNHIQLWQPRQAQPQAPTAPDATPTTEDPGLPSLAFVDGDVAVLTLRNFGVSYRPAIDSLAALLEATPPTYLLIDIRRNPGGDTRAYTNLIPFFYTNPIRRDAMDIRASERNLADIRERYLDGQFPEVTEEEAQRFFRLLEDNIGEIVPRGEAGQLELDRVLPLPRRVGVVIGRGCASKCEQLALDAMASADQRVREIHLELARRYDELANGGGEQMPQPPVDEQQRTG
jgi:hypothetical protein